MQTRIYSKIILCNRSSRRYLFFLLLHPYVMPWNAFKFRTGKTLLNFRWHQIFISEQPHILRHEEVSQGSPGVDSRSPDSIQFSSSRRAKKEKKKVFRISTEQGDGTGQRPKVSVGNGLLDARCELAFISFITLVVTGPLHLNFFLCKGREYTPSCSGHHWSVVQVRTNPIATLIILCIQFSLVAAGPSGYGCVSSPSRGSSQQISAPAVFIHPLWE